MERNPEVPAITLPLKQAPHSKSDIYYDFEVPHYEGIKVSHNHFWRRIIASNIGCGDAADIKVAAKVGLSRTLQSELASALEIGPKELQTKFSAKLGTSTTLSDERSIEITRKISPRECRSITFAEWQKISHLEITRPRKFLMFHLEDGFKEVDSGTEEFYSDIFDYPDPDCCPKDFNRKIADGFDKVYGLTFGSITSAVLGKSLPGGKVALDGLDGVFSPGQLLNIDEVEDHFSRVRLRPSGSVGRLSLELLADAASFFNTVDKSRRAVVNTIAPAVALIASIGFLLLAIRKRKNIEPSPRVPTEATQAYEEAERALELMRIQQKDASRTKSHEGTASSGHVQE
jgi:hypothetical protein